jgi:hypothetical protein
MVNERYERPTGAHRQGHVVPPWVKTAPTISYSSSSVQAVVMVQ